MKPHQRKIILITVFFICTIAATVYLWYVTGEEQSTCNTQTGNISTYECAILQTLSPIALDYYAALSNVRMDVKSITIGVMDHIWSGEFTMLGADEYFRLQYRITNNSPHYIRAGWPVFIEGYHCGVWLNWPIGATGYMPFVIIPPGAHHDFVFIFIPQLNIQPLKFRIVKRAHYVSDPSRFTPHLPSHHLTAEFTLDYLFD